MHSRSICRAAVPWLFVALAAGCGGGGLPLDVQPFTIASADGNAAWSPDGTRIAYFHAARPSEGRSATGLWIVDTAGVATHEILPGNLSYPSWSPDGTHLTISYIGIYTIRAAGDSLRKLTTTGFRSRWSPVSNQLMFERFDTTGVGSVLLMSSDGSGVRQLATTAGETWYQPDWSPDGRRIVHIRRVSLASGDNLFVMDTTGHAEQRLTTEVTLDQMPAWSPDGQWIAWTASREPVGIWLIRPDGTGAHFLTYGNDPAWSPDSKRIVYSQLLGDTALLYIIDLATLRIRQITQ